MGYLPFIYVSSFQFNIKSPIQDLGRQGRSSTSCSEMVQSDMVSYSNENVQSSSSNCDSFTNKFIVDPQANRNSPPTWKLTSSHLTSFREEISEDTRDILKSTLRQSTQNKYVAVLHLQAKQEQCKPMLMTFYEKHAGVTYRHFTSIIKKKL